MEREHNENIRQGIILTGGDCDVRRVKARGFLAEPDADRFVVAADSGYLRAAELGLSVDLLVGDFDSMPLSDAALRALGQEQNMEIFRVPCEKDETDTMLACRMAIERGCGEILILGGFGGRCDHELSNIFLLENLKNRGVSAAITDGDAMIRFLRDETATVVNRGGYFSVFALDNDCTVTLTGCKYPLTKRAIRRDEPFFTTSNEVVGDAASVTIEGSALLCDVWR